MDDFRAALIALTPMICANLLGGCAGLQPDERKVAEVQTDCFSSSSVSDHETADERTIRVRPKVVDGYKIAFVAERCNRLD